MSNWPIRCCSLLLMICLTGCSNDGGVKPFGDSVPVSGMVTFSGKPLSHGVVAFAPLDPKGQTAIGKIQDGHFEMVTTASSPGVIKGKYQVRIQSLEALAAGDAAKGPGTPMGKPKSLIPEKYDSVKTSGLEVDVVDGMQPLKFDLAP